MSEIEKLMRETARKKIRVVDDEGEEYIGVNMVFEDEIDNYDEKECSICILLSEDSGICLFESEIKSIEVLE